MSNQRILVLIVLLAANGVISCQTKKPEPPTKLKADVINQVNSSHVADTNVVKGIDDYGSCDKNPDIAITNSNIPIAWKCKNNRWVIDNIVMKMMQDREDHKIKLYRDLISRPLSDDEMQEVLTYGVLLVIPYGISYQREDMVNEYNAALLQQFRLRLECDKYEDCYKKQKSNKPNLRYWTMPNN